MAAILTAAMLAALMRPEIESQVIVKGFQREAPLLTMLMAQPGGMTPTANVKFNVGQDNYEGRRTQVNNGGSAYDATTTSIVVDDGSIFQADSLILCEATREVLLCTGVSTNTLTVVRGWGTGGSPENGVAAAAGSVADNAYLTLIGTAKGESAASPTARMTAATLSENGVQTFRRTIDMSGLSQRTELLTENERLRQVNKIMGELFRDIEMALMYGAYEQGVAGADGTVRGTSGLANAITTNAINVGGTLTENALYTHAEQMFQYVTDTDELVGLCGGTLATTLAQLFKGYVQVSAAPGQVGVGQPVIVTPHGRLRIITSRHIPASLAGSGFFFNPSNLRIRHTLGRDMIDDDVAKTGVPHIRDIKSRGGTDATRQEAFAELGLQWFAEHRMTYLRGVTGPA